MLNRFLGRSDVICLLLALSTLALFLPVARYRFRQLR